MAIKSGGAIDPDKIARALVDATLIGDDASAEKHGISARSIKRYRAKLSEDESLALIVRDKKALHDADWAEELPGAIHEAIGFLKRASQEANPTDPLVIHSIAGALKILTDVTMSRRVLDARLARTLGSGNAGVSRQDGPIGEAPGEGAPADEDKLGLQ